MFDLYDINWIIGLSLKSYALRFITSILQIIVYLELNSKSLYQTGEIV